MDGIFNVLKPPGMTSHDVVGAMRKILQMKKSVMQEPLIPWLPVSYLSLLGRQRAFGICGP